MDFIRYIDRQSGKEEVEKVYYEEAIRFLYGKSFLSRTLGRFFTHAIAKWPFFSWLSGIIQKTAFSKRKIVPFIKRYDIDVKEFQDPVECFSSFNDFFIRKLKPEVRPLSQNPLTIPADGRYRFYNNLSDSFIFSVKNRDFTLKNLLRDDKQAEKYAGGSLVAARLCPTDCHRFYFPCDCKPKDAKLINGMLYSVNPIAINDNPWIYSVNRRVVTYLETEQFGQVAFLEIGATTVGSIVQTYTAGKTYKKGQEKGYFSFGGSALIVLFEPNRISFDQDLLDYMKSGLEIRALIGQSFGRAK